MGASGGAQPVMDASSMVTQREHLGQSHRLVGDRRQQALGRVLDGQLDGVAIDAGLTLEQAGERGDLTNAHAPILQLSGRDGTTVHEACADRGVALTFSEVHATVHREESNSGVEPDRRLAGETLAPDERDETPDGVAAAI